ncbi:aspartate aminotransferase family protein [Salinactinospora qingdaonensis]|uniref:aspartate aminotransferase family protein n=1 Tax=Salinactinospora qingdaonensis TaxID=702744 RepID=UPI0031EC2C46
MATPTPLISKSLHVPPIEIVDGQGLTLVSRDGDRYLDSCGGVAVSALGHRHPRIVEAMEASTRDVTWVHAGSFTTRAVQDLAAYLTDRSAGLDHVYFMSGGSEIMEVALKLVLQHHMERGQASRTVFVSRRQSYHGSTLATLSLSGNTQRRACFDPALTTPVEFVSPCYSFREKRQGETDSGYVARLAGELDETITRVGSRRVAAFVMETVVGSTSGAVPPVPGYLAAMKEVCSKHGVLLLLDEIMCGLGRTGRYFAFHDDDVEPDIVTVGKGLGAGYAPMSALLATEEVMRPLREGSGVLENGQTHVNNPHGAAVALAVQKAVCEEGVLENSVGVARYLRSLLEEVKTQTPVVGDVRGRGMFLGLEFVDPEDGRSPLPHAKRFSQLLKSSGLANGVLLYPGHGTVDGTAGAHLLLAPPLVTTDAEAATMVERVQASITAAFEAWRQELSPV